VQDPPPWRQVVARLDYQYPWNQWIVALKSGPHPGLANTLAALWLDEPALPSMLDEVDWWLPIPASPTRLAQCGHHPVWSLMQALARLTPTPPAATEWLQRRAHTPPLHQLGRAERLAQVGQLFTVPTAARATLRGQHVLVVDDVMTTGATLRAASRALLDAGAARVSALVVARTPAPME
jgi:predicted amidophosphoribosyltransferase